MSMQTRLSRLLFIVPYVAQRDGVLLDELACLVDSTPQKLVEDIELLRMVGRPPLTPDHLIDIYIEDNLVCVTLDQRLRRPPRLTADEASAVLLAIQLVARDNRTLAAVIQQLRSALGTTMATRVEHLSGALSVDRDAQADVVLTTLQTAVSRRQELSLSYYSASSDRSRAYLLWPLALASHSGFDYLVALDKSDRGVRVGDSATDETDGAAEKLFRVDRMSDIVLGDIQFPPTAPANLDRFARANLFAGQASAARVRFSSKVARRVVERFAAEQIEKCGDGAVIVDLVTSSPAWLARWVLPFAAEAEVLGPADKRQEIAAIVRRAHEVYSGEVTYAERPH